MINNKKNLPNYVSEQDVKLEDGSKEGILMWADEDCSRDELSALAHEKVMNKFGGYSEFRIELN